MHKFGMVMVSYPYSAVRADSILRSITSLAKTNVQDIPAVLQITYRESGYLPLQRYAEILNRTFAIRWVFDGELSARGQSQLSTVSGNKLLGDCPDVTHLIFMYDDFIYNPEWLQQLSALVDRHPGARAWSVYRSSYTVHHRIMLDDGVDVMMTMHDGTGCVEREEWLSYRRKHMTTNGGANFDVPQMYNGGGSTFDCHHSYMRQGARWATRRDYWQNIGVHEWLKEKDMAIDFVGE